MTRILGIDFSVVPERGWRVGGTESELLKDLLLQRAALVDGEEVAIFAIRIDDPIGVDRGGVDTPFETERMIRDARNRSIWIPGAALGVRIFILPLNRQGRA